jgi:Holliday junction resolvasome RuvABC endonuclease subunit
MNYYGGVDLSYTGTAIVIIDDNFAVVYQLLFGTPTELVPDEHRQHVISRKVVDAMWAFNPVLLCIEGYSFGGPRLAKLVGLGSVVGYNLWRSGYESIEVVQPSSLKLLAAGHGRASKEDMIAAAQRHWPECNDDNLADAYHLAVEARRRHLAKSM